MVIMMAALMLLEALILSKNSVNKVIAKTGIDGMHGKQRAYSTVSMPYDSTDNAVEGSHLLKRERLRLPSLVEPMARKAGDVNGICGV